MGNNVSLRPGMFVSNEPGYYEDGEFGIRIENILLVVEKETPARFVVIFHARKICNWFR